MVPTAPYPTQRTSFKSPDIEIVSGKKTPPEFGTDSDPEFGKAAKYDRVAHYPFAVGVKYSMKGLWIRASTGQNGVPM